MRTQQFSGEFGRGNLRLRFAFMQHEFKTARAIRPGKREARARRIAKHFCVARVILRFLQVQDKPAFPERRTNELDPQLLADETAPSIARHEILRGNFGHASVRAPQNQINCVRSLSEIDQFGAEPRLGMSLPSPRARRNNPATAARKSAGERRCVSGSHILSRLDERAENRILPH